MDFESTKPKAAFLPNFYLVILKRKLILVILKSVVTNRLNLQLLGIYWNYGNIRDALSLIQEAFTVSVQ